MALECRIYELLEERQEKQDEDRVDDAHRFRLDFALKVFHLRRLDDPDRALLVVEHPEDRQQNHHLPNRPQLPGVFVNPTRARAPDGRRHADAALARRKHRVLAAPSNKNGEGRREEDRRNGEGRGVAKNRPHGRDEEVREDRAEVDGRVEHGEVPPRRLARVADRAVDLIRTERGHAGLDATRAQADEHQGHDRPGQRRHGGRGHEDPQADGVDAAEAHDRCVSPPALVRQPSTDERRGVGERRREHEARRRAALAQV
mmetsp:Transcript_14108/g.37418  ORF Transcript_14108/g.37418 Transcript_14108/m.37418 type:complete len:259 (+) Transcript_14108:383-1159(+)